MCTISAASCFPEPFVSEGKRLGHVHRNFAGSRFSDHVALLSVFQAWDEVRCALPSPPCPFCVVVVSKAATICSGHYILIYTCSEY